MKIENPFQLVGYHGTEYFCDREEETKLLLSAIKNGRNLNLFNIRRIGKTALIHHVLNKLPKSHVAIFIDISQTETQQDLAKLIIENIAKELDKLDKNFLRRVVSWASSFGASIGYDSNTGSFEIGVKPNVILNKKNLFEVFEFTKKFPEKKFVIAIDEFQQILSYSEKNTEALFRSLSQQYPEIRFIYSGSSRNLMEKIFANPSAPFYQITEHLSVGYISEKRYFDFAKKFLPNCEDEIILHFIRWTRRHTYYTQFALNRLYQLSQSNIEFLSAADVELEILLASKFYFDSVRKLVTQDQWKILKGIAKNEPVNKPLSMSFSNEIGVAQSTIKYNLAQLVEKDLVFQESDGYKIYDVFFGKLLTVKSLDS